MFRRALISSFSVVVLVAACSMYGSTVQPSFTAEDQALIDEHVYGGLPSTNNIHVRQGYILSWSPSTRTPSWVAYHVVPDYMKHPKRKGRFSSFRGDPDISNEPTSADYTGLLASRGYARGHLAPFAIMGGDRDGDGDYAEYHPNSTNVGDAYDAETVYQSNYRSNIAPQHHTGFNGGPDLWYELERWIQDDLVKKQESEVWVFAGCVFGQGTPERVGTNADVAVPPMFFKIVILDDPNADPPIVLAYLLPHQRVRHGELDSFLVSVDVIEALTGLDFFPNETEEDWLEDQDTWNFAQTHFE